ncbi:hypothetical protein M426DRAFT_319768 [Hypoxylon sp. CI-4A]|nr:hypothetical protein M426DRAFT_319768 [Hypoxylon sp. CI-4A]
MDPDKCQANTTPFNKPQALNKQCLLPASCDAITDPERPQGAVERINHIPGEPTIPLTDSEIFLRRELSTPVLDEIFDKLWLVGKQSSSNIDALHRQIIKGREIVPAEDPRLHLVWQERRIFVKPIPCCLLNHDFWIYFLSPNSATTTHVSNLYATERHSYQEVALGFLRSYAFLIQHRTDLLLAKKHDLIPEDVDWIQWSQFIAGFRSLADGEVAKRYRYGQLRLTRLNWATCVLRPRSNGSSWFYEEPYWSTTPYVRGAVVPLAFLFAGLSIILGSMQVMLAVPSEVLGSRGLSEGGLVASQVIFWAVSSVTLVLSVAFLALLVIIPSIVFLVQLAWAIQHKPPK